MGCCLVLQHLLYGFLIIINYCCVLNVACLLFVVYTTIKSNSKTIAIVVLYKLATLLFCDV